MKSEVLSLNSAIKNTLVTNWQPSVHPLIVSDVWEQIGEVQER